ncbi:MAG: GNAT family N-acetyltransferase [Candidatus Thorarchaeota archaeon]|nr:GNAT family N-acetyltransferase [Candidatus Thorarchaeota archaeon]
MSESADIRIVEYDEKLAKDLAVMYNGWEDLWPTGYTQGVPFDEERVKKQFNTMSSIAILIAVDNATNKPVGSCTLHAHVRDADAAYVGTLGVSPEALNKKVGKRLLLRSIEIARADGRKRMDLNTWPGNMRAVPLYKKVGLMWNPSGDGVQMEDYIPGILDHPLAKSFFDSLPDGITWYEAHQRELTQAPDDYTEENMEIFPYRFSYGDNSLSVIIDKHSRHITAIERGVDGSKIKVRARVVQHKVLCGVPSKYILEIENGSTKDADFKGSLKAFSALTFEDKSTTSLKVQAGESVTWEVGFTVGPEAPIHRRNIRTPTIDAALELDGVKFTFRTGLIIKPAAEIMNKANYTRIIPGGAARIPISIISASDFEMKGSVHVESPSESLRISPMTKEIQLQPEGQSGIVLDVEADPDLKARTYDLLLHLKLASNGVSLTTRKFRIPVYCLFNGSAAIGDDDRLLRKTILSEDYVATFDYEGAIFRARYANADFEGVFLLRAQIGPPFGIDSFRFSPREVAVSEGADISVVAMKGAHPERPLHIEDRAVFERGTGIVIHQVWATNTGKEPHSFQVRMYGGGQGINLNVGTKYIPLKGGVVADSANSQVLNYPTIPSSPNAYDEGWIAIRGEHTTIGEIWDISKVEEIQMGGNQVRIMQYPIMSLEPGERRMISEVFLVLNASGWQDVQRLYRLRIGKRIQNVGMETEGSTRQLYDFDIRPAVIPSLSETEISLRVRKAILAPLPVNLDVEVPEAWQATLSSLNSPKDQMQRSSRIEMHPIADNEELQIKLKPSKLAKDGFIVYEGNLRLRALTDKVFPFNIIQLGSAGTKVEVSEIEEEGCKGFHVKNGRIEYKVSHEYGGCLYSLKNSKGTELLISSFPTGEAKPGGFLNNYYGGIQPVIWDDALDEEFTNVITNREKMEGKRISIGPWSGVEVSWTGAVQRSTRGVRLRLQYLTTGGSPLVLTRWIIENVTDATLRTVPSFIVDAGFNGEVPDRLFRAIENDRMTDFYASQVPSVAVPRNNLLWIRNGEIDQNPEGLAILHAGKGVGTSAIGIGGIIIGVSMSLGTHVSPGETKVSTSCFVVDPKSDAELMGLQKNLESILEEQP